uniref:non-specific serine/threonine protein kinase n=1 Tax=Bursaphelenchus xylophilus TaxID=6326 RepID=A0A1I7RQ63_BURXY
MDIYDLDIGKPVNKKWVVEAKVGEGACGVVYRVHDVENKKIKAALKTEANDENGVLRKEANVIKQLQLRKHMVRLIHCGKREQYSYIVMTLYGKNLNQIKKDYELKNFTHGCVCKIAIQALYAIKQVHEVGYIHRDVKPSNMVIGRQGMEKRMVFLIDFGMCRAYAVWEGGVARHRKAREKALLRGTARYCSPQVHSRQEQGRRDDVWALVYVMVELADKLPWTGKKEPETAKMKQEITDEKLLEHCPSEWLDIFTHIRNLTYEDRPNYRLIYDKLLATMTRLKTTFTDLYDWESRLALYIAANGRYFATGRTCY